MKEKYSIVASNGVIDLKLQAMIGVELVTMHIVSPPGRKLILGGVENSAPSQDRWTF